jgi:uncharacterized metal-binding protein YceD (DUF177 family)
MKLGTAQLKPGDNPFHFEAGNDGLVHELIRQVAAQGTKIEDVKADLVLTNLEPDFFLRGTVEFKAEQVCGRCAEPFTLPACQPIALGLAHVHTKRGSTDPVLSEQSEDLDIHFFEGNEIELLPILEESVFLSIPYAPICRAECKGLCQSCGTNLNLKACSCQKVRPLGTFNRLSEYQVI